MHTPFHCTNNRNTRVCHQFRDKGRGGGSRLKCKPSYWETHNLKIRSRIPAMGQKPSRILVHFSLSRTKYPIQATSRPKAQNSSPEHKSKIKLRRSQKQKLSTTRWRRTAITRDTTYYPAPHHRSASSESRWIEASLPPSSCLQRRQPPFEVLPNTRCWRKLRK